MWAERLSSARATSNTMRFQHLSTLAALLFLGGVAFLPPWGPSRAFAQPPSNDDALEDDLEDDEEVLEDEDLDDYEDDDLDDDPQLRAPTYEMPDVATDVPLDEDDDVLEEGDDDDIDPANDVDLLSEAEPPPSSDPTLSSWTSPRSIVSLHGYLRVRGELWDNFFLGRGIDENGRLFEDQPFSRFIPADRIAGRGPDMGSCEPTDGAEAACDSSDRLRFGNMRLRLAPSIALSDDVQVHMMIDAFDNLVLGSTPENHVYVPSTGANAFSRVGRAPGVPFDTFVTTQDPPQALRNSARDSVYFRRAWAQVRNRGLGEVRFGRMGSHWGLGMLQNSGEGIDGDYSTDVDRIMLMTKLGGFHWVAAYDFAAQGITNQLIGDLRDIPYDLTAKDDIQQFVFASARREDDEVAEAKLHEGGWVLEGGLYFIYRSQSFTSAPVTNAFPNLEASATTPFRFIQRDAKAFIPDLWGRFRWGSLRLEAEMAAVFGSIGNVNDATFAGREHKLRQFGLAFESELRLLDDKLAIRLYTGFATGDQDVDGLSARQDLYSQRTDDTTLSTFQMHPNYRVDLILWRNIMQRVAGAWYLKPGLGYDIIRSPFGQVFGARADVIYSRAAQEVQTYGSNPNLGLELNFSLYYRSEDGPDLLDGFYASFQYGVLFPLDGLGHSNTPTGMASPLPDPGNAQALRLILGVQY